MFLLLKMTKGVVDMKEKIFSVLMQTSGAIFGESPIEEPYSYVEKGSFSGEEQPASLAAFGNYDFILKNLRYTAVRSNGIESYELYWILSLIDYYEYSGDAAGTESLLSEATGPGADGGAVRRADEKPHCTSSGSSRLPRRRLPRLPL